MRKAVKNNLLEIFKTIYEAHGIVKGFIDKKEYENAQSLLADCQDTAIQLGNLIEESEGEGFVTVSFLEEYCEALYEAGTNLSEESNGHKVQKQLDKKIIKAENSVKNDIKVKLEVVFMPYKASMWDSLESVWKAADEDPDCDAYVVPIPYYDRKPGGAFGEFHYEGGEYPNYVPVTYYEEYNLDQRRPDVIYIHNPYDGNNYVTSVDPRFYSSELKKYTNKLVYIPYFVSAEPDPENIQNVKYASRYVITPGVINADNVIVQSEAMRQTYIKALLGHFGDTPNNRRIVEKKICGIGSPKFDKVTYIDKENVDIPDEWKKIITKSNGDRKVVIFYNTSLGTLLEQNEKMLKKMKNVFEIFYENKDDVALLWRPHPLIKATIESMRPQLWKDYKQIVDKYIADGWGIYDDTSDLNRAIALCDGYYGDRSSVVQLCVKAQKNVLLQNAELIYTDKDIEELTSVLSTRAICRVDDKIYCSAVDKNALVILNAETFELTSVEIFKDIPIDSFVYHGGVIENNDIIYFYPCSNGRIVHKFDIRTKKQGIIELEKKIKCTYAAIYDNLLYLFPDYIHYGLTIINLENDSVNYNFDWYKANSLLENFEKNFLYSSITENKNIIFSHLVKTNQILITDFKTKTTQKITFECNNKTPFCAEYNKGMLWYCVAENGNIYSYSLKENKEREYSTPISDTFCSNNEYEFPFRIIVSYNKTVLAIPSFENSIYILDETQNRFVLFSNFPENAVYPHTNAWYCTKHNISDEQILIVCCFTNVIISINMITNDIKFILTDNQEEKFKEYYSGKKKEFDNDIYSFIKTENPYIFSKETSMYSLFEHKKDNCLNVKTDYGFKINNLMKE